MAGVERSGSRRSAPGPAEQPFRDTMTTNPKTRTATRADRDALHALQHASMRALAASYYDEDVIEAFIDHVGTMDDALLDDGTYYTIHIGHTLAACGGWTLRAPSY